MTLGHSLPLSWPQFPHLLSGGGEIHDVLDLSIQTNLATHPGATISGEFGQVIKTSFPPL